MTAGTAAVGLPRRGRAAAVTVEAGRHLPDQGTVATVEAEHPQLGLGTVATVAVGLHLPGLETPGTVTTVATLTGVTGATAAANTVTVEAELRPAGAALQGGATGGGPCTQESRPPGQTRSLTATAAMRAGGATGERVGLAAGHLGLPGRTG